MTLNTEFITKDRNGLDIGILKLFVLLYADDIVFSSEISEGLQNRLNILYYFQRWKLTVSNMLICITPKFTILIMGSVLEITNSILVKFL